MKKSTTRQRPMATKKCSGEEKKAKEKKEKLVKTTTKKKREEKDKKKQPTKAEKKKKKKKKEKPKKETEDKDSDTLSSSSSTASEDLVVVGQDNPFLMENQQKQLLPGALKEVVQVEKFTTMMLRDERPDIDTRRLTEAEATMMDSYLRGKSDLVSGDCLYTEDNNDEDERNFVRYEVQLKYNEGRYSAIYLALRRRCVNNELVLDDLPYLLKLGLRKSSARTTRMLEKEARVLYDVGNKRYASNKIPFTPVVLDQGRICGQSFIIMNYLDRNLAKIQEDCGGSFGQPTAIYAAIECFNAMADFHGQKYVHRDIKPTNFCSGIEDLVHRLFLIDFGDSVKRGSKQRQPKLGVPDGMTLPYWSLEAHHGGGMTMKGDMESWFYLALELIEPRAFVWGKETKVDNSKGSKRRFWEDFRHILTTKALLQVAELLAGKTEIVFPKDHVAVKQRLSEALETSTNGKQWTVDWVPAKEEKKAPPPRFVMTPPPTRKAVLKKPVKPGAKK